MGRGTARPFKTTRFLRTGKVFRGLVPPRAMQPAGGGGLRTFDYHARSLARSVLGAPARLLRFRHVQATSHCVTQKPSRRRFLKLGIAGAVLLGGGTALYRTVGRFGPAAAGYKVFDDDEVKVLEAACEAHFPGAPEWPLSAKEAGCAQFVDRYLSELYSDNQTLFRALLRTLNLSTLITHRTLFKNLDAKERLDVLESWASSSMRLRRGGYASLTLFIKMGYYENEKVREALGYSLGCEVSQEGRPQGI
jgi:hypothetical protein